MKVYCRFAPPNALFSDTQSDDSDPSASPSPAAVLISLRNGAQRHDEAAMASLTVTEPGTGSSVSLNCCSAFLPDCVGIRIAPAAPQEQQKKQQCEVFDKVVRPCISELLCGRRCAFLAYGQTATGKTYTIFGPDVAADDNEPFTRARGAKEEREGEKEKEVDEDNVGLVPRLLRDLFAEPKNSVGCVDISCVEVYNECATDLVALQLRQRQRQPQRPQSGRRRSGAKQTDPNGYEHNTAATAAWLAWALSEGEERANALDVSTVRTTYRPTEKSLVMRSALRLRAVSAEACWALIRNLLALRQCTQTERNVRSSRSHLLLRLELRGAMPGAPRIGEAVFADLAGSESYRDYGLAADRSSGRSYSSEHMHSHGSGSGVDSVGGNQSAGTIQNGLRTLRRGPIAASTFAANLCDSNGFTPAQRTALKTNEMRHINSSLLALRKVLRSLHTATAIASSSSSTSSFSSPLLPTFAASAGAAVPAGVPNSPVLVTTHIPFRDSMLTTILEPFLVPGGKESIIAWVVCCSMKQRDFHETVESLRLGADASAIPANVQISQAYLPRTVDTFGGPQNEDEPQSLLPSPNVNANVTATAAPSGAILQRGSKSELSTTTTTGGDPDGELRKELDAYKRYAQQLLEQCDGLCESYNECVEELFRTKEVLAARDQEIAQLRLAQSPPSASLPETVKEIRDKPCNEHCEEAPAQPSPDEEALRLVESILRRHSIQHTSERSPLEDIPGNRREEAECPLRRRRTVSFVPPSRHGAVPLAHTEKKPATNSALPPPVPIPVLRTMQGRAGTANTSGAIHRL